MRFFTDAKGRKWEVEISVPVFKRIRALLDVDAYNDADRVFARLGQDDIFLVDFLFAACKPQADALSISDEDFGASLHGDPIAEAADAVMQAYVDYFPSARRKPLQLLLDKVREGNRRATSRIEGRTEDLGKALDRAIDAGLDEIDRKISGVCTTSSPPSPASIPTVDLSGN